MDILQQTIKSIDEDKSKYESEEKYKKFVESMEGIYVMKVMGSDPIKKE